MPPPRTTASSAVRTRSVAVARPAGTFTRVGGTPESPTPSAVTATVTHTQPACASDSATSNAAAAPSSTAADAADTVASGAAERVIATV